MRISIQGLEQAFRQDFAKKYRRFGGFMDSGPLWEEFCQVLGNRELLSHILFCNDVMQIPPVRTHLMISKSRGGAAASRKLNVREKQELGAAYGFLFKEVFHYPRQESVSCVINTLKTATRYEQDEAQPLELTKGECER
ncbi:hypothetical protein D1646_08240 [Pseudoflavonifractor sp. 60]|uniref:hypothetical protein n=1 Tax=Pseudoflavonifractor sp. 60 TaxID=2304576 RepID=UPI0013685163|nr:hypothetical protein [Pseudoflavonifractor sp. 60]NBI66806.1 hypothetical protein [Pseudoflavonifractor sp. 60]